jgi:hypothetical protein
MLYLLVAVMVQDLKLEQLLLLLNNIKGEFNNE